MILLITKDLFFVPTVRSAADKLGSEVRVALSFDSEKVSETAADQVTAWILDLNSLTVAQIEGAVQALTCGFPGAKRIAFGPHVQHSRLEAAEQAGCEQVLSRGQLSSQVDRLMTAWV